MNRNLISLAGLVLMAAAGTSANAETKFIANSFYDGGHPLSKFGYVEWADIVKDLSGGDLAPEVYTGTVLLAPRAALQGAQDNVVQVANISAVYIPSEMPVANAVQKLGFNYSDPKAMIFAATDFSMHNPTQLKEWTDNKIVYLGAYTTPPYILFCTSPVTTLAEFKGKRIRSYGVALPAMIEAVGAVPVGMPDVEAYEAMSNNVLDCSAADIALVAAFKLDEVAHYFINVPMGASWGHILVINKDVYASLSDSQKAILDAMKEDHLKEMLRLFAQAEVDVKKKWKDTGAVEIIDFPADLFLKTTLGNARVQEVRASWKGRAMGAGMPEADADAVVKELTE